RPMTTPTRTTTQPTALDVDNAVRAVLDGMVGPRVGLVPGANGHIGGVSDVFAGRLLALRHAEALPPGTNLIRVAPGTVITPLARDNLKRLGIEVRFVARSEAERVRSAGEWGFAVEASSGLLEALRRSLLEGAGAWREVGSSLDEAAGWVGGSGGRGRG